MQVTQSLGDNALQCYFLLSWKPFLFSSFCTLSLNFCILSYLHGVNRRVAIFQQSQKVSLGENGRKDILGKVCTYQFRMLIISSRSGSLSPQVIKYMTICFNKIASLLLQLELLIIAVHWLRCSANIDTAQLNMRSGERDNDNTTICAKFISAFVHKVVPQGNVFFIPVIIYPFPEISDKRFIRKSDV